MESGYGAAYDEACGQNEVVDRQITIDRKGTSRHLQRATRGEFRVDVTRPTTLSADSGDWIVHVKKVKFDESEMT